MKKKMFSLVRAAAPAVRYAAVLMLYAAAIVLGVEYFNGSVIMVYVGLFVVVVADYFAYKIKRYASGNPRNLKM